MNLTQNEFDALLRNDLTTFIARTFAHLDPQTPFAHNWHIDLLADRLTQVYQGKIRRLIITLPPRHLKSICASVAFPAWILGRDPSLRLVCASYGQDLSEKLARDTMSVMSADWYKRAFATRLRRIASADFETTQRGGRMATSVGGVLTGRGGEIVIIDDPVKPDEALSEAQRRKANEWFDNTVYTRLNNKATGAIIIIMQRLHLDDLVGHALDKEAWEVVNLPAIAPERHTWTYRTLAGPQSYIRQEAELLHASREPQASLDTLRNVLGSYAFSAQYYSVCTTWGVKGKKMYLLNVVRQRLEYPTLKQAVINQAERYKANAILIEDKASGTQLIQELRETNTRFKGVKSEGDKVMRMLAQTPQFELGNVLLPKEAPWLADYVHELTAFPSARYDDQVDSTAQAIKWMTGEGRKPAAIRFYIQQWEASHGRPWVWPPESHAA